MKKARKSDLDKIKEITRDVIKNYYAKHLSKEVVDTFLDSGVPFNYIVENIGALKIIERENSIVGFCILKDDTVELIMVKPAMQTLNGVYVFNEIYNRLQQDYKVDFKHIPVEIHKPRYFYVRTDCIYNQ